jgi:hypothetical protein
MAKNKFNQCSKIIFFNILFCKKWQKINQINGSKIIFCKKCDKKLKTILVKRI